MQFPLDSLGKHWTVWVQTDLRALEVSAHIPAEKEQEKEPHKWKAAERCVPWDDACMLLHLSVLPLLTKTHNVISSLVLRAALPPLNHRAAQTDMIRGWVSV